ncbi:hypothetical protein [Ruminococcus albus]|uniref:Immunity protein 50 n=1 Tax=Ruminococcus albus TaxID=1264 RepID=A0A1H7K944_RUMAL|nr:hypothetical protein [Ruminococcus albus]SEK82497.1 hypothetical protein SAMN05216469_10689 [Ruminococcus albus]
MFDHKNIDGIEILKEKIPSELQYWHFFGNIEEMHYCSRAIDEFYCDYTNTITMLLTNSDKRYRIELNLYNIRGDLHFDMANGFFSGFTIDEFSTSASDNHFHLYSCEQDIGFDLYCEKIRAVLKE